MDPKRYDNVRCVRLRNCKLAVTPHQFCTSVRMLFMESKTGIGGGVMALAPVLGKTYIVLFLYAFRTLLFTSRREVEIEWADTDKESGRSSMRTKKNHLPRDTPPGQGLRCPSGSPHRFGVRCYCVPNGITRVTIDSLKPGVTVISVPTAAMPNSCSVQLRSDSSHPINAPGPQQQPCGGRQSAARYQNRGRPSNSAPWQPY